MYTIQGFKAFVAVLFLCLFAKYVSGAAYPGGSDFPTANFNNQLVLSANKDSFDGATWSTSWTASPSTPSSSDGFYIQTTNGLGASSLQFTNKDQAAKTYSLTWASGSLGLGVRIVARVQATGTGTTASATPTSYLGWTEGASGKSYFATYTVKKDTTANSASQQAVGYFDGTNLQLQPATGSLSGLDIITTPMTVQIDVLPKNISFSYFDSANANQGTCGLYRGCYTGAKDVTSVTPATTGSMFIGGVTSGGSTNTLVYQVDWIAQYNYAASGASLNINKTTLSIFSLFMGALLFILYQRQ